MEHDGWKDGPSSDAAKEHADYMARIAKHFVDAFQANGFTRAEAMELTIAILPKGMGGDHS